MVANGRAGVWEQGEGEEYGGNKSVENKEVKIPTLGSTPAHRRLPLLSLPPWQNPPANEMWKYLWARRLWAQRNPAP